jgi:2-polyprenyl-6-methoxyphenol hydroxylase-like FAD-dependent oxidoreductase
MKIKIIGAGPAGLYFARLRKLYHPGDAITIHEQNPQGSTFGFGVSIAERATERYQQADPELIRRIAAASLPMPHQRFTLDAQTYLVTSTQYGAAIERQRLLDIMAGACTELGVDIRYQQRCEHIDEAAADCDLLVGADGANSVVLSQGSARFEPRYGLLANRFAWYGLRRRLPEAGLSFRHTPAGRLVGHYYPYTEGLSTFVAEVDGATWDSGFGALDDAGRKAVFEEAFAAELLGERLVENRSVWRQFRPVDNTRWQSGNRVLLGDALAAAHYSIGSGTRLAMDDALALHDALDATADDIPLALPRFESTRRPVRQKLMGAARRSWDWYEDIAQWMQLPLMEFIHTFMARTGRMDAARLAQALPGFAADYARWCATAARAPQS